MNSPRATIRLEGQVDHITHANAATHYTVAHLSTAKTHNRVTITGIMPGIKTGETLRIEGTWETHPRFGPQFRVQAYTVTLPATVEGIRHYLASGIVKGIGPFMAHRIVEHFGAQTLAVIEADPQKLQEVEGIGQAKAALIARAWKEHHTLRELIRLLQDFGLQAGHAPAILQAYGGAAPSSAISCSW
ncbi:MAG: ATP-dependent RecD-like DNA helicase, partial [Desulfobacterales bacterium]|nr:ATP-dependent RecD-like DNA helicase [Desulfobacterales bacterium]